MQFLPKKQGTHILVKLTDVAEGTWWQLLSTKDPPGDWRKGEAE